MSLCGVQVRLTVHNWGGTAGLPALFLLSYYSHYSLHFGGYLFTSASWFAGWLVVCEQDCTKTTELATHGRACELAPQKNSQMYPRFASEITCEVILQPFVISM